MVREYYRVYKSLLLDLILGQLNPVRILTLPLKIYFKVPPQVS
jgi:hypothetical protein